jgi:hypothetical protein
MEYTTMDLPSSLREEEDELSTERVKRDQLREQKLLYTLLITSRKLRHYFQGHPIKVVTDRPLETILRNPNVTGRVAEWAVDLQPFEISFETTKVIKSKALADSPPNGLIHSPMTLQRWSLHSQEKRS